MDLKRKMKKKKLEIKEMQKKTNKYFSLPFPCKMK
jgi:hypothetical protein